MNTDSYLPIVVLVILSVAMMSAIVLASHFIGGHRRGPVKDSPYESGVPVVGDARRRFNVKFYLVAMLFLLFDVEVVFLWPWAMLYYHSATTPDHPAAQMLHNAGHANPAAFLLAAGGLFFGLLLVGYLYDLSKGIFRWS